MFHPFHNIDPPSLKIHLNVSSYVVLRFLTCLFPKDFNDNGKAHMEALGLPTDMLTKTMTYGTRRFNAVLTMALQ